MQGRITGRANRMLALALHRRDGGLCRRCGKAIDASILWQNAGALTIGHVVPMSRGGTNDLANLAAEHRRCNLQAGDREPRPVAAVVLP